ncbi:MAG TPA: hypothetical protein PLO12_10000 [Solirubrobacterales bacterium]|nr:hypothetical protein [Solirubrobacterales bacterium]
MAENEGERPREMRKTLIVMLLWLVAGTTPALASPPPVSDWVQTNRVQFSGTDGFFRSQGVASDGQSLFFSWNLGLSRTAINDTSNVLADNTTEAIPDDLAESNHNHIGDIDVAWGWIYAPIEDGPAYAEPWVVIYDADTLEPTGQRFLLPASLQRDGVPWIAVDQVRGVAYSMEWKDTGKLFVYSLSDFSLLRTVTLSEPVPRIQGAKIYRGNLYASRDNGSEKSIVAIDPETGTVTHLFDRNLGEDYEAEGIAFVRRSSGTMMVATGIREGSQGYTEMRIYRIGGDTTAPALSGVGFKAKRVRRGSKVTLLATSSEPVTALVRWLRCIGPAARPCSRTRVFGSNDRIQITEGSNEVSLSTALLRPGIWNLRITPSDRADIVGRTRRVGLTVLRPRR